MSALVFAVDRSELAPFPMPERFRTDVAYFMMPPGDGFPKLPRSEYWIRLEDVKVWLDDGVVGVISPLDSSKQAEFELTEEQEAWLEWLVANQIQHVRVE